MKFILLFPILFIACQEKGLKVGDCIQKPDEIYRYQIIKLEDKLANLKSLNGGQLQTTQIDDSMWTLTSCD